MRRLVVLLLLLTSCARLNQQVTLRAEPLEAPRVVRTPLGEGLRIAGARTGDVVRASVVKVQRCADVQEQRAMGIRRTVRSPAGQSLLAEWLFGGLFTAGGLGVVAWTAAYPEPADSGVTSAPTNYALGAAIAAVGAGFLAGALYDQSLLGVHEEPLGERVLKKQGPELVCGEAPATSGQVRLTLSDGTQLEAPVDAAGEATVTLPPDVEKRLEREGSRRATLEAIGDVRAQIRIQL